MELLLSIVSYKGIVEYWYWRFRLRFMEQRHHCLEAGGFNSILVYHWFRKRPMNRHDSLLRISFPLQRFSTKFHPEKIWANNISEQAIISEPCCYRHLISLSLTESAGHYCLSSLPWNPDQGCWNVACHCKGQIQYMRVYLIQLRRFVTKFRYRVYQGPFVLI